MKPPPEMSQRDIERAAALFALKRLPQRMRSELLSDRDFTQQFGIEAVPSLNLGTSTLPRAQILDRFREIFSGVNSEPEHIEGARFESQTGDGLYDHGGQTFRLSHIDLLRPEKDARVNAWGREAAKAILSARQFRDAEKLVSKVVSDDTFVTISMILDKSPDSLRDSLAQSFVRGGLNNRDLVTGDPDYWEALLPAPTGDNTAHYIETDLKSEFDARVSCNRVSAVRWLGMLLGIPAVAQSIWVSALTDATIEEAISSLRRFIDPFASAGALHLAAKKYMETSQWDKIGEEQLKNAFSDLPLLDASCHIFSSAFLVTTGFFGQHAELRDRPVYWRRMAAVLHSNLVVRACGSNSTRHRTLWDWARGLAGIPYLFSGLADFAVQARWRPDWIEPGIIVADLGGYIRIATTLLPNQQIPSTWISEIDAFNTYLSEQGTALQAYLPGPTEGDGKGTMSTLAEYGDMAEFFHAVRKQPTIPNLVRIGPLVQTFGVPVEAIADISKVLTRIQRGAVTLEDRNAQNAITVAAHVATLVKNEELGQSVVDTILLKARYLESNSAILEATARLVECSTAFAPARSHLALLGGWLEQMVYALNKPSKIRYFKTLLSELEELGPAFRQNISRATSVASLGAISVG